MTRNMFHCASHASPCVPIKAQYLGPPLDELMNGVTILPVSTLASHKEEFGKNKKYQCTEKQNEQFSVFSGKQV